MALLDIRKQFVEFSGRYDLVIDETTWADNGADWFIQAAQRYLDRKLETGQARAKFFGQLLTNRIVMKIPYARVIEKVTCLTADGRHKIRPLEERVLRIRRHELEEHADIEGMPIYYSPTVIKIAEDSNLDNIIGSQADVVYQDSEYTGIAFDRRADIDYNIEIEGLFYSPRLLEDTSISFWTEVNPEILVAASLMTLERFYRNMEGVRESKASVDDMVMQLDFDYVAQEIVNITRLEG